MANYFTNIMSYTPLKDVAVVTGDFNSMPRFCSYSLLKGEKPDSKKIEI